jgi:glycosyltransferase involved in cell wall biosynthesis
MRIAFYAPMKHPDDPRPSGDRQMARLLCAALARAGFAVESTCRFCSFDGGGNALRQSRLADLGDRLASSLLRRYENRPAGDRPDLWFTYHLYHKAPDWLGPRVSLALNIPYAVAEASHAPKQEDGPWSRGLAASAQAISAADLVFGLNGADAECVRPLLAGPERLVPLAPFIDTTVFRATPEKRARARAELAERCGFTPDVPLLLVVAMMRPGDKLASYRCFGGALGRLGDRPWRLLVVGDGPARAEVGGGLRVIERRITWLGRREGKDLAAAYAAADLYVWPAIGEAYGLALLEAQAAGLPVVAGRTGGVAEVVADGETGLLAPVRDEAAFAAAVGCLLSDPHRRRTMGARAQRRARREHDLVGAARTIGAALASLMAARVQP